MIKFPSFLQNSLIAYKPIIFNPLTVPINLSEKEKQIFNLLKEIIKENNLQNIELFAVGGWVRDHLINIKSNDLDIAVKGIDTNSFAKLINQKINKDKNKYAIVNNKLKKQDGKEIILTKTTILDVEIDFVELQVNIIEDAKERDFTFNALYYNILQNKVEDPLNMGINDLKNGFIRTCVSPNKLFNYDSLNILRMLRFAAKYQFVIDDQCLNEIVKNKNIYKDNLLNKISKERIHKELNSIFCSMNPSFAIYSLYKLGLFEYALHLNLHKNNNNWLSEKDIIKFVNIFIIGKICFDKYKIYFEGENFDDKYKYCYYSILLTIGMRNFTDNYNNSLTKIMLAKVLKTESKNLKIVNHFDEFNNFISKNEYSRLNVGILIRKILFNNISKILLISVSNEYVQKNITNDVLDKIDDNNLDNIFNKYFEFYKYIKKENLEKVNELKSIMDGKEIKTYFPGLDKKYLSTMIETLINKQIENNNKFSKDDAINEIKLKIQELKIEL